MTPRRSSRFAVLALALALVTPAPPSQAQEAALSDEERVTAIDLLLVFERPAAEAWASGRGAPTDLGPQDFQVTSSGRLLPVVSVEALEDSADGRAAWRQVIYIDCAMASTPLVRRAAADLQARARTLVAAGEVSVVLADPSPRPLLRPTRDAERLEAVLSRLALAQDCRDGASLLRDQLLRQLEQTAAGERAELAADALQSETDLARRSRLALANHLAEAQGRAGGAQNVVYLVHAGFDPDPLAFYRPRLGRDAGTPDDAFGQEELAKVLAAYGWATVALAEAPIPEPRRGVSIGRWYFTAARPYATQDERPEEGFDPPGQTLDTGQPWRMFLGGIKAKLEERRDEDKAEGFLELGTALYGQGKYDRAEDALRQSLYHFADHAKTRDRQAEVWIQLGNTLAAKGQRDLARKAVEHALGLDPSLAAEGRAEGALLAARPQAFDRLADATLGAVVTDGAELDAVLTGLGRRVRLTYQVAGLPDGLLRPLEVRHQGGLTVRHAAWTRSSTPRELAAARLLRMLDPDLGQDFDTEGGLDVHQAVSFSSGSGERRASLDLGKLGEGLSPALRITVAWGDLAVPTNVEHLDLQPADVDGPVDLGWPGTSGWMAVLAEDLETGAWGAHLFDL